MIILSATRGFRESGQPTTGTEVLIFRAQQQLLRLQKLPETWRPQLARELLARWQGDVSPPLYTTRVAPRGGQQYGQINATAARQAPTVGKHAEQLGLARTSGERLSRNRGGSSRTRALLE